MTDALRGVSVLVVEDDPETLELFTLALSAVGATVSTASNAPAALARIRELKPDVVLCDINLPGHDGYSLLEHVRGDELLAALPMISISGSHPELEIARSREAGFAHHLTKPVRLPIIVETLAGAVGKSQPVAAVPA